jgi:uncharacterized RDD family membrane protein YckC
MVDSIDIVMGNPQLKDHWIRRGIAYIIDSIIIFIVMFVILLIGTILMIGSLVGGAMTGNPLGGVVGGILIFLVIWLIALFFSIAYWVYFDAKGGTIGKKFMKLKPVALEGEMDYPKAFIRNISKIAGGFIGALIFGSILLILAVEIGLILTDIFLGLDKGGDPRRKYTDHMAGTTVVRTDVEETFAPTPVAPPVPEIGKPLTSTPETSISSITEPSSPVPGPVNPTSTEAMSLEDKTRLDELRDKFLMGEITEEQYLKARKSIP